MTKEDWLELEDEDEMINKIKNQIFNLNDPSEFPRLFTDEEFLEIEKNTSYDNGLEEGKLVGLEEGKLVGLEEGKLVGIKEGIEQANIDNARKMKQRNMSYDLIGDITGLDSKLIASL